MADVAAYAEVRPDVSQHAGWSSADLANLALLHRDVGNHWALIARHFPLKTAVEVEGVFHCTLRCKSGAAAGASHTLLRAYVHAVGPTCDDEDLRKQAYEAACRQARAAGAVAVAEAAGCVWTVDANSAASPAPVSQFSRLSEPRRVASGGRASNSSISSSGWAVSGDTGGGGGCYRAFDAGSGSGSCAATSFHASSSHTSIGSLCGQGSARPPRPPTRSSTLSSCDELWPFGGAQGPAGADSIGGGNTAAAGGATPASDGSWARDHGPAVEGDFDLAGPQRKVEHGLQKRRSVGHAPEAWRQVQPQGPSTSLPFVRLGPTAPAACDRPGGWRELRATPASDAGGLALGAGSLQQGPSAGSFERAAGTASLPAGGPRVGRQGGPLGRGGGSGRGGIPGGAAGLLPSEQILQLLGRPSNCHSTARPSGRPHVDGGANADGPRSVLVRAAADRRTGGGGGGGPTHGTGLHMGSGLPYSQPRVSAAASAQAHTPALFADDCGSAPEHGAQPYWAAAPSLEWAGGAAFLPSQSSVVWQLGTGGVAAASTAPSTAAAGMKPSLNPSLTTRQQPQGQLQWVPYPLSLLPPTPALPQPSPGLQWTPVPAGNSLAAVVAQRASLLQAGQPCPQVGWQPPSLEALLDPRLLQGLMPEDY
ncbi:hypothetical protein HYH03_011496 [Edaphochlamys debaryana]|uniref:Uncharacterized protein n=1 Tax=Edaphochlamys debaryana TaxID=47281 RepID=A0A836BUX4_9CHLO|nr:hypothetical protein HYH03_011496 [Edaphochlamys debaryana]|eukprot:KAG2490031.1 hypothetical protein HYH03_011496 [Edaphochlamys debaryana]